MAELLVFDGVTAGYGGTAVLDEVSFTVGEAGALALLGRNGVGKTTVLSTIMGLTTRLGGSIRFLGKDLADLPSHRRNARGIALVPQEREIFSSLTVIENLKVAARRGDWTVERVFDLFPGLAERRRNLGDRLSGGEQQMLAMGRALIGNPSLVLLDEPFEGLAPLIVEQLAEVLARVRGESRLAMILVEHHAELALDLTDHAVVLDRGAVIWRGASEELRHDTDGLARLIGLDAGPAAG